MKRLILPAIRCSLMFTAVAALITGSLQGQWPNKQTRQERFTPLGEVAK